MVENSSTMNSALNPASLQTQLRGRQSINNQIRAANVESQFDITPVNVSEWRDIIIGDGSVTVENLYELTTSTDSSSRQRIETAQIGNYLTGSISTMSVFAQKETVPNGVVEVGYGRDNANNGMWLQWDNNDEYSVVLNRGGVKTTISQDDWFRETGRSVEIDDENGDFSGRLWGFDPATGSSSDGAAGINVDMTKGQQYQFSVSWGGPLLFSIDAVDRYGHDHSQPVFLFDPRDGRPVMTQPNHPVFGEIRNEGSTQQDTLKIGGRQFIQYGTRNIVKRRTEHLNDTVSIPTDSYVPVTSFRRKENQYPGVTLQFETVGVNTDNTIHVFVMKDPTFNTAGTWSDPQFTDSDETAIEIQDEPDVNLDGAKWNGFIAGSGKNVRSLTTTGGKEMPIPRNQPVVLFAKSLANQASVDVSMTINEFW